MEQTNAASSPAEAVDVFHGEPVSLQEYERYRQDGEVPERFNAAETAEEAATSNEQDSEVEETESAGESEPPKDQKQEKNGKKSHATAEQRIAQLEATIEKIRRGAGLERKTEVASVVQPQVQSQPATRPKPTTDAVNQDGTPKYATYEEYVEDLADWKAEQRWTAAQREQMVRQQATQLQSKVDDARARYGDGFDEVLEPTVTRIMSEPSVAQAVKAMLNDSEVLPDVIYVLGSDPQELQAFLRMPPGKQLRYIAQVESEVQAELDGARKGVTSETKSPAKTQTAAPKPPSPVGGASSRAFDVSDESLSAEEWARKRTAELARRKKA